MADVKVKVPEQHGDQIEIRYAGDDPVVYKISDGSVNVQQQHLDRFLAVVDGAEVAKPATSKK